MAQGSLKLSRRDAKGGRTNNKHSSKMKKGTLIRKPKKLKLAELHNKHKVRESGLQEHLIVFATAIGRNIEKATGKALAKNGEGLSLLKKVSNAVKGTGDEVSKTAKAPKFDTRKQFRLTS